MLTLDPSLGQFVTTIPLFTFKRATSVRDRVVNSEFKGETGKHHCKYKGTYMCGNCNYCKFLLTQKKRILPNGQTFHPKHFANCKTIGSIYMLQCSCGCFYIRKTKLELWRRVYRHIRSMQVCNPDLPLGRYFSKYQIFDFRLHTPQP